MDLPFSRAGLPFSWHFSPARFWSLARFSFLLLLCGFLFFYRLGERDLTSSHEARAAQNAATIINEGQWGLPRLVNQRIELQKPPLYYWTVALLAWLQGGVVDAVAVRLPAALAALATVLCLYLLCWYRNRPTAGFMAAIFLATFMHFTWLGRVGRIDMPLTLAVCLALGGFYFGTCRRREGGLAWPWFLLAYLAVALGILLKGPIAVVLPAVVGGALLLLETISQSSPNKDRTWSLRCSTLWWGIPLMLVITAPWFIWANIQTCNRLFEVFFWYHNVERGLGGSNLGTHPWWFYGPRLVLDLLPWSLAMPLAGWYCWRRRLWNQDMEGRFGFVWLIAILVFLSLMRFKRADYLLPAYPGAALWLGCLAERWLRERQGTVSRRLAWSFGFVLIGLVVGWGFYFSSPAQGSSYRPFAADIRRHTQKHVIFFRAEAHELVFYVGQPMDTILEWENLDIWASSPTQTYFVMPVECARDWPKHLQKGRLEEVLRTPDSVPRPLVLLRSIVPGKPAY